MAGQLSSTLAGRETRDVASMTFEERLQMGAENAVRCMGVGASDRVPYCNCCRARLIEWHGKGRYCGKAPPADSPLSSRQVFKPALG